MQIRKTPFLLMSIGCRTRFIGLACFLFFVFSSPFSVSQEKENADFKLAVGLYNDGMYDLAVEQLKNFINAYAATSQGIDARFTLGLTQMKLKRFDEARITFQNFALAYVEHPKAPDAWMNVGEAFLSLNNVREAASAYERVKVFHPKSSRVPEALLKAGALYRQLGERENAMKMYRTIIQDYATSNSVIAARLAIGELYAESGEIELAENEARRVSGSEAPATVKASALFSLGKLRVMTNLFDDAESTFTSLTKLYPNTAGANAAMLELGKLALSAASYATAIDHLKKVSSDAILDDSLQAQALFELGNAYARQRLYPDAQKSYEKVFTKFSKSSLGIQSLLEAGRAALNSGRDVSRNQSGNTTDALKHAKKILSLPNSLFNRQAIALAARACNESKQFTEALRYLQSYVESYPDDPSTPYMMSWLGRLYQDQREFRKASIVFDQLAQKYPQSPYAVEAMRGIAECMEGLADNEGALKLYADLLHRYPANVWETTIEDRIKHLQDYTIKNRDAGIEKLARLIGEVVTQESKASLSFQLGEIYLNDLKDYGSAAKQFTVAIENKLDPEKLMDAYYYRARAYYLQSVIDTSLREKALTSYAALLAQYPQSKWSEEAAYYKYLLERVPPSRIDSASAEFITKHPMSPHRAEALIGRGNRAFTQEQYTYAIRFYNDGIASNPTSSFLSLALLQKGLAYISLGKTDSAVSSLLQAVTSPSPTHYTVQAMGYLADLRSKQGNLAEAITLWKRITDQFPYCSTLASESTDRLAEAYVATGSYDDALAIYEHHLQELDGDPFQSLLDWSDYFKLATGYEKKGELQRAIQYYHTYLVNERKGPLAMKAFYALGGLARIQGKTDAATSYFKQAAALGGASIASKDVADLLFQTEQYMDAAKQYTLLTQKTDSLRLKQFYQSRAIVATLRADKLLEAQQLLAEFKSLHGTTSDEAEFEFEQGTLHYRKQDYASAKKIFEHVADEYVATRFGPWAQYYLGKILEVNNKLEEAAKRYESLLKKSPLSDVVPRVYLSLGNMHFNAERFEESIKYYQQITNAPETAGDILSYAMNNLIEAYESTKLYDAALKTTRDYIERYPNDESIIDKKIKLGTLYTKIGFYDQAVVQFQTLINEGSSVLEAELRYNIGEAYYYKGDYQQAILEFLKVPYLVSKQGKVNWTATSFYMAGQAYEKVSKFDEAIGMYQQIIDRPGIDATFKAAARKEINRVKLITRKGSK